jgi:hypothetical protein
MHHSAYTQNHIYAEPHAYTQNHSAYTQNATTTHCIFSLQSASVNTMQRTLSASPQGESLRLGRNVHLHLVGDVGDCAGWRVLHQGRIILAGILELLERRVHGRLDLVLRLGAHSHASRGDGQGWAE